MKQEDLALSRLGLFLGLFSSFAFGLYVFGSLALMGCRGGQPSITGAGVRDADGVTYRLVEPAKGLPNGTVRVELWERDGDTNHWYTPSLSSRHGGPRRFVPISR